MKPKDVLETKGHRVVTVPAKSSVADAIRAMHAEKVGAVMVPDAEGCPVGIFTERDVVRLYADGERESIGDLVKVKLGEAAEEA
jgi:CBS domain-containing protein